MELSRPQGALFAFGGPGTDCHGAALGWSTGDTWPWNTSYCCAQKNRSAFRRATFFFAADSCERGERILILDMLFVDTCQRFQACLADTYRRLQRHCTSCLVCLGLLVDDAAARAGGALSR